jgi:hypothetical protein
VGKLLTILLAGTLAGAAGGAAFGANDSASTLAGFHTPSGNIGCIYSKDGASVFLRCDIATGIKPAPKKPRSCELDYGSGYSMSDTGRARVVCAGDTVLHQGPVLKYGTTWRRGGFTCRSKSTGLSCTNRSQHGFFLSRAHSYVI